MIMEWRRQFVAECRLKSDSPRFVSANVSGDEVAQEGQSALENFRTQWYLTQNDPLAQNRSFVI